jgi:aminoglycoside phosphotransferase family enzyme/predicted kinase
VTLHRESLPPLIQSLLDPSVFPHPDGEVMLVQTHISYVFLVGEFAYKVKKPLNLGFLDYSTLERREYFCRREVELNRRLCPDLYLGVVPIVAVGDGFRVGGEGRRVEWAVEMRRLQEDRLLSNLLEVDRVEPEQIERIARRLAEFHARAATGGEIDLYGQPRTIRRNTDENFAQLLPFVGRTISAAQLARLRAYTDSFLNENRPLFAKRVGEHRIRDCHGDLHAGSICLADDLCIFDCIEFNDRFRYGDVLAEVAFLAMDLDRYGRADLSWRFVDAYRRASGDDCPDRLLDFYKCYRAVVRAKVESFKLDEPDFTPEEKDAATEAARVYVDLASVYAGLTTRPILLATCGLMGTGKSTLARALARRFGLVYLSSDVTRKRLVGLAPTEHRYESFGSGIYAEEYSRRTYEALLREAGEWLSRGCSVVVDASFKRSAERAAIRRLADDLGIDLLFVECVCSEELIRSRVEQRVKRSGEASDARWDIFSLQKQDFDPCDEIEAARRLVVNTAEPIEHCIDHVRGRLTVSR